MTVVPASEPEAPSIAVVPGAAIDSPKLGLRKRAVRGLLWTQGAQPVRILISVIRSAILTRLLFPEAFGLMAMGSVVGTAAQMFSDVGIRPSIVRSPRGEDPVFLQTAWTVQVIRGVILSFVALLMAWPAAVFFNEPMVFWVVSAGGLGFFIRGFASTAGPVHHRKMLFARPTILRLVNPSINLIVMVLLAWWLESVWALIFGSLTGVLIGVLAGHLFLPGIKHRFRLDRESLDELFNFGKWVFVSTVLTFLAMQSDKILLGKLLSAEVLGYYSIALVISEMPKTLLGALNSTILFAAVAEKTREKDSKLAAKVSRARAIIFRPAILLIAGMVLAAPFAVHLVYDPRYETAGWFAQWLGLSVWFNLIAGNSGQVLLALGKSRPMALANGVNAAVTIIASIVGFLTFEVEGFLVGYALGNAAAAVVLSGSLARNRIRVLAQDGIYTLLFFALVATVVAIRQVSLPLTGSLFLATILGVIPIVLAAAWIAPGLFREAFGKRFMRSKSHQ